MYSITKNFKFEAAHRLFNMPESHPCHSLHGHSYVVKVTISTKKLDNMENPNMIIDFRKLKVFQNWLDENFDHATILHNNDPLYSTLKNFDCKIRTIPNGDTTAENMARFFSIIVIDMIKKYFKDQFSVKIEVVETVGNTASYEELVTV